MEKSINNLIKAIHLNIEEIVRAKRNDFIPGKTVVTTALALFDHREINAIIDSLLDGWLGISKKGLEFEEALSKHLGTRFSTLVNSGSSANLLALEGIKKLLNIDKGEIITPAAAFPTTFNPIIQTGFKPAIIDIDNTLNITPEAVSSAINKNTVGIIFAHTMGNPARIDEIAEIASENNLFLIEDCCGSLGSKYDGKMCGTFGIAATCSFNAAHGITMGEGGAVVTGNAELNRISKSLRDWGRDCRCDNQHENFGECGKRFDYRLDDVYYDHRYIYSQVGYNFRPIEIQAAMGIEQLKKVEGFNEIRKRNFDIYRKELSRFGDFIRLPEANEKSDPVFFGLPIIINNPGIDRKDLIEYLNENRISTRLLFAGNILRQPAYRDMDYSLYGDLNYTNKIMKDCFWIGLHPGITGEMIEYVVSVLGKYFKGK